MNYLVNGPLSGMQKGVSLEPQTKKILPSAIFGKLNGFFRSIGWKVPDYVYLDYSLVVAIVMGVLVWFLLFRTRQGFEIRAVGTSIDVSPLRRHLASSACRWAHSCSRARLPA